MKSGGRTELEAETEDVKIRLHLTPSLSEDHPLPYPLSSLHLTAPNFSSVHPAVQLHGLHPARTKPDF